MLAFGVRRRRGLKSFWYCCSDYFFFNFFFKLDATDFNIERDKREVAS